MPARSRTRSIRASVTTGYWGAADLDRGVDLVAMLHRRGHEQPRIPRRLRIALRLGQVSLQHRRCRPLAELRFEQRRQGQPARRSPRAHEVAARPSCASAHAVSRRRRRSGRSPRRARARAGARSPLATAARTSEASDASGWPGRAITTTRASTTPCRTRTTTGRPAKRRRSGPPVQPTRRTPGTSMAARRTRSRMTGRLTASAWRVTPAPPVPRTAWHPAGTGGRRRVVGLARGALPPEGVRRSARAAAPGPRRRPRRSRA